MILRAIHDGDVEVLAEMEKRCFKEPWTAEMFSALLSYPFQHGFIAEEGGQVCGYCCLSVVFDEAEILNIAVDTSYRKRGFGEQILESVLEKAKELGAEKCFLEVRVSNFPAISLYEKYGYQTFGVRAKYYPDGEDAYVMKKVL
jgi:ribosomal-protein-alanine N-acetyltransferase